VWFGKKLTLMYPFLGKQVLWIGFLLHIKTQTEGQRFMASGASTIGRRATLARVGIFTGRRGRILKENLTAYLFLFPAVSLIFVFGIFPVAFSLYVSMYRWKIKQGDFRGLDNYLKALDNLAYVIAFTLTIGSIWLAVSLLIKTWRQARLNNELPWLLAAPGVVLALTSLQFIKFVVLVLPEILSIGEKVQRSGVERSRELFVQFFREAFQVEAVAQALQVTGWLLLAGVGLLVVFSRLARTRHKDRYVSWFFLVTFFGLAGYLIGEFTYSSIQAEYLDAVEGGEALAIWPQVISISLGFVLLYLSWLIWQSAGARAGPVKMVFSLLAAVSLLGAAWILIGELPPVLEAGDEELWSGLEVTAWFSFATVPIQLALGLGIAYLLFQNIRGKSFFRMLYFLPYITPAVASAAVFRIIFSNRPTGMMNRLWIFLGFEPLNWLLEPQSVFTIFGLSGPSLALVIIILFNIWAYVGYNAIIFLAGLGTIPGVLYEAAEIDGANRWQLFQHITLPLLSPATYFLTLLGVIGTFKAFNHVFILRQEAALRTVDTLSMVIWDELKTNADYGYAATLAFVLFGVVLILTVINNRVQGERVFYG
jgi:multiple sugar transport system permease protein